MSRAVQLTVAPEAAQVALGEQLSLAITVRHTGRSRTHYRLDVSGIPADWYTLDRPYIALHPAASAQVLLTVHPPARPVTIAGRYTLTVHVQAAEDPDLQTATAVALTVGTGELDMDVQPAEAEGREATFRITFVNRSPTPTPVRLSASDHENWLRFRSEPEDTVFVPAGGAADPITVHVAPKVRETMGRPHRHQLAFRGQLLGREHTVNPSLVGQARFTSVAPWRPVWLRWASRWAVLLSLAVRGTREREQRIQTATAVALSVSTGELDMDVQPTEVEGREATFHITFVNRSSTPTPVRLSTSDHENRLRFRIEPEDTVVVPAGEAADPITVHVAPKGRETMGRPHRYQLEFRGLLLGREHTANSSLVGQAHFTCAAR